MVFGIKILVNQDFVQDFGDLVSVRIQPGFAPSRPTPPKQEASIGEP